jgi:hypothetical protein
MTSRTWDYIAGACIVIALGFLLVVAGLMLGMDWHRTLLPVGLIFFLAVVVPLLLRGLGAFLSRSGQANAGEDQAASRPMFARATQAARIAALLVGAFLLLQIVLQITSGRRPIASNAGISTVAGKPDRTVSILFIGNSFTFGNDLPGMLVQVASSDATNKVQLEVHSATVGGATLNYMFHNPEAASLFRQQHWDYLVLQEQSEWTGSRERIADTYSAVNTWNQAARQMGTTPVLYETWADQPGSTLYTDRNSYFFGQTPEQVQPNIDAQSSALARHFQIAVVPVGSYWAYAEKQPNAPNLYAPDHHHPSAAGTYLTALAFYRFFTGNTLAHVTYRPRELTPDQGQFLIGIVSQLAP